MTYSGPIWSVRPAACRTCPRLVLGILLTDQELIILLIVDLYSSFRLLRIFLFHRWHRPPWGREPQLDDEEYN